MLHIVLRKINLYKLTHHWLEI